MIGYTSVYTGSPLFWADMSDLLYLEVSSQDYRTRRGELVSAEPSKAKFILLMAGVRVTGSFEAKRCCFVKANMWPVFLANQRAPSGRFDRPAPPPHLSYFIICCCFFLFSFCVCFNLRPCYIRKCVYLGCPCKTCVGCCVVFQGSM